MQLIDNRSCSDPAVNLALEEYLVRHFRVRETVLLFYVNAPAVVIGRNQVPHTEVNLRAAVRGEFRVVRRLSGGGAVYHDRGNLNFSLIQIHDPDTIISPAEALQPVVQGLEGAGLPVYLNDRHDIMVAGRKVTGTAQYRTRNRCLTHGTLLVSADLAALRHALDVDSTVTSSRGRPSVRSPVTNLNRYQPALDPSGVREILLPSFAKQHGPALPLALDADAWERIRETAQTQYRSWDWTMGRSPAFQLRRNAVFPWGPCEALLDIQRGILTRIDLSLPAGAPTFLRALAAALEGCRYHPADIKAVLQAGGVFHAGSDMAGRVVDWLGASRCPWC
jgi:lipoate---protein ligase